VAVLGSGVKEVSEGEQAARIRVSRIDKTPILIKVDLTNILPPRSY
jgi:hypothetical protein